MHEETLYDKENKPIGTVIREITDPDEMDECRELDALDWNRYRIWEEDLYHGTVDFMRYSVPAIDPPMQEFCERNQYKSEDYKPFKCTVCKQDIPLSAFAWWVDSKPYCEKCAAETFMNTVPTNEPHKDVWCRRCGFIIEDGEDAWEFPDEETRCDRCAAIEHRLPVWKHWYKET